MAWYRVFLHGENFQIESDDRSANSPKIRGFYTTRFVEAASPEAAEMVAVEMIRDDDWLQTNVKNAREDPPMIFVEEIDQIDARPFDVAGTGYIFYSEEMP